MAGDDARCRARSGDPYRCSARVFRQSQTLAVIPDEYAGGRGLLDVLADHYRVDSGIDSG